MTTLSAQTATSVTTTNHGTLRLRPSSLQPSPATPGFPITSDWTHPLFTMFRLVFRILHRFKLAEGIAGHCSVRDPIDPNTFWVNPQGKSFALMKQSDLVRCSVEDGRMVEGLVPTHASASPIHSQLYKSLGREPQGIEAVVHVHGPHTEAFSSLLTDPRQINFEMCCQAQLLADAARRPGDPIVEAGPEEIASTEREMGSSEMGRYSLAAYVEEEEYHAGGRHKL